MAILRNFIFAEIEIRSNQLLTETIAQKHEKFSRYQPMIADLLIQSSSMFSLPGICGKPSVGPLDFSREAYDFVALPTDI